MAETCHFLANPRAEQCTLVEITPLLGRADKLGSGTHTEGCTLSFCTSTPMPHPLNHGAETRYHSGNIQ
jgi:hypothetical protein